MGSVAQPDSPENLAIRTRRFAVAIVRFYMSLPKTGEYFVLGRQLLRSGTSVGAQYREARRAKSRADFVSKMQGSLQELDETVYWLEVLTEAGLADSAALEPLARETNELVSIFVSAVKRAKEVRSQK
jgi:four helix bundle protein